MNGSADDCALILHENPAATCAVSCVAGDYGCEAIKSGYQPSAWENAAVVLIVIAALWWWVKKKV